MRSFFYRNGHASLQVLFNNKFYDVNSPILHKTYSKMAFLVHNINKSLSTFHNKKITNNVLYVHIQLLVDSYKLKARTGHVYSSTKEPV